MDLRLRCIYLSSDLTHSRDWLHWRSFCKSQWLRTGEHSAFYDWRRSCVIMSSLHVDRKNWFGDSWILNPSRCQTPNNSQYIYRNTWQHALLSNGWLDSHGCFLAWSPSITCERYYENELAVCYPRWVLWNPFFIYCTRTPIPLD